MRAKPFSEATSIPAERPVRPPAARIAAASGADLLACGDYGRMVALMGNEIGSVELSVPEGKVKTVPQDHYMIDTAAAVGTCMGV